MDSRVRSAIVTFPDACYTCHYNKRLAGLPARERIGVDGHWRVAHALGTALPGWLVLVPLRHVTAIADLTDAEAAGLGLWQVRLSRALTATTGCVKTYVVRLRATRWTRSPRRWLNSCHDRQALTGAHRGHEWSDRGIS